MAERLGNLLSNSRIEYPSKNNNVASNNGTQSFWNGCSHEVEYVNEKVDRSLTVYNVEKLCSKCSDLRAVGGEGGDEDDKEKEEEAERERQEAIREAEERRKEKHRKMEEEREKMRQEIRDKPLKRSGTFDKPSNKKILYRTKSTLKYVFSLDGECYVHVSGVSTKGGRDDEGDPEGTLIFQ
uniref:Uncharacterized protein n=1 Tax=Vespula pensylvanica TaxID=30213 RepID=A0A834UE95_VESPE|nr:hypothetical protein H0235_002945 [Vespula pensylvanica]